MNPRIQEFAALAAATAGDDGDTVSGQGEERTIRIEVVYALPERQWLLELDVPAGTTVGQAVERSGLPEHCAHLDAASLRDNVGIFGRRVDLEHELRAGDRVEIYRPLRVSPRELRRQRARHGLD